MNKSLSIFFSLIMVFGIFGLSGTVNAATLSLVPETKALGVGQEFSVDVRVDTKDVFINAVQSKVTFSDDVLEMVGFEKNDSVFNFWIGEPDISNDNGTASFIGGTDRGESGDSLQILRLRFKTVGSGTANISLSESVVTANDGKGTNVLDSIENITITVGTRVVESRVIPEAPVVQPERVEREALLVEGLPNKPILSVPAYDSGEDWYGHQYETIVLWEVPADITRVAISVDGLPNSEPMTAEDELFTGKNLGILDEGIHYIHVQFKNNKGWGGVAHYEVKIDTTSPPDFEIKIDSAVSDNPTPEISYRAEDSLSGYSHALIIVDGKSPVRSDERAYKLSPQKPGRHALMVRIFDKAGNEVSSSLNFEILPIDTPVVDFITHKIPQDEYAFVSGRSIPNSFVDIRVFNLEGNEIYFGSANTDISGEWKAVAEELFPRGEYSLVVSARDDRGAISYPSEPEEVKVTSVVVFSVGFVDLGWFEIALIIILLVISGGSLGSWYYVIEKERKSAYGVIASRDVAKMSKLLGDDLTEIENIIKQQKRLQKGLRPQLHSVFKSMRADINNMKKYLGKSIEKSH